jgi:hypothetical protein
MTLEEELKQIDFEIRRLKVQYDLYFYGSLPRPPNDQRDALARQVRRLQGVEMRNMADRFLYNNVVNKFNTFFELWTKLLRAKEEGRVHPLAQRAAQRAAGTGQGGSRPPAAPPGAAAREPSSGAKGATTPAAGHHGTRAPAGRRGPDEAWRIGTTVQGHEESLRGLYNQYVAARHEAGDRRSVPFDTFAREVARQAAAIKGKADCEVVEFRIYSREKKVTLKARPGG